MILVSRNGADTLPLALEALAACEVPPGDREILLVDNGSSDETPGLMRVFAQEHGARVLTEPRPGKSHGLNLAIEAARGEMLAFIDDDIVVSPGWLMAFHEAARTGDAGLMAGRIEPLWQSPPPRWLEHLAAQGLACGCTRQGPLGPGDVKGGNMAINRMALGSLRFDTGAANYGPGRGATGGEDTLLAAQLADGGARIASVTQALARHVIQPGEMALGAVVQRYVRIGRGNAAVRGMGLASLPMLALRAALRGGLALGWLMLGQSGRAAMHLPYLGMNLGRMAGIISR